jgi:hypothetical protein
VSRDCDRRLASQERALARATRSRRIIRKPVVAATSSCEVERV